MENPITSPRSEGNCPAGARGFHRLQCVNPGLPRQPFFKGSRDVPRAERSSHCVWQLVRYLRQEFPAELTGYYLFDDIVVRLYTSDAIYSNFNKSLLQGNICSHVADYENALNHFIDEHNEVELLPDEVYRGMNLPQEEFDKLVVGEKYCVPSFISTTARPACAFGTDKGLGEKNTLLIIRLIDPDNPEDCYPTSGIAHIARLSAFPDETEHLIGSRVLFRIRELGTIVSNPPLTEALQKAFADHNNDVDRYNAAVAPASRQQHVSLAGKGWKHYIIADFVGTRKGRGLTSCCRHKHRLHAFPFPQLQVAVKP